MKPMDIEKQSFAIIESELTTDIPHIYKPIVKRVIHTTADFSYETSMTFSDGVVTRHLMPYVQEWILLRIPIWQNQE